MAEIVNLRRARKAKARTQKASAADANRIKHGTGKAAHKLAKARTEKTLRAVDAHKLEESEEK